jgi:hypothetical protein
LTEEGEKVLEKLGPVEERKFTFRILLTDKQPQAIPFVVEGKASPYDFCIIIIHNIGAHSIEQGELVDADGKVMMYYQPARGWYFGQGKDVSLPSLP